MSSKRCNQRSYSKRFWNPGLSHIPNMGDLCLVFRGWLRSWRKGRDTFKNLVFCTDIVHRTHTKLLTLLSRHMCISTQKDDNVSLHCWTGDMFLKCFTCEMAIAMWYRSIYVEHEDWIWTVNKSILIASAHCMSAVQIMLVRRRQEVPWSQQLSGAFEARLWSF